MNWISDVPRRAIVVVAIGLGGCAAATPPAAIATVNLPSTQPDQTVAPTWPDIEAASEGAGANAPDLAAGRWYELCNTRLDSVAPQPLPPGVEGVSAVIDDWSGAVLDSRRSRLLVWGGGHGGYAGNEIYAFDPATGSWSIIWGPTPLEQIPQGPQGFDEYPDGNPGSRHTYDNLVYDVANDALWSSDGSLWQTGKSTSGTWSFDLQTNQWRRLPPNPAAQIWAQTAYDPKRRLIVRRVNNGIFTYDPQKQRWRKTSPGAYSHWHINGEIDHDDRLFIMTGGQRFDVYNLDSQAFTRPKSGGDQTIVNAEAPGLSYHPALGEIVGWAGGEKLYRLSIARRNYSWTEVTPAHRGRAPGKPNNNGTYGRFRYVPTLDAFVVVNNTDENVFVYKLGVAADAPEPAGCINAAALWTTPVTHSDRVD